MTRSQELVVRRMKAIRRREISQKVEKRMERRRREKQFAALMDTNQLTQQLMDLSAELQRQK